MKLIFLFVFCFSQFAFACPQAFVGSYGARQSRTSVRVTLSTPKENLMLFSKREVQDLNYVEVLNLLFNKNVTLQIISFLSGAQVNGLISLSQKLRKQENSTIFYLLVRMHTHLISPRNIPWIPVAIIKELLVYNIKRLSPQQIAALTAEQVYALTRHQIRVLSREQIQAFTPQQIAFFKEHIEYFSSEQLALFLLEQINAISPSQAEYLESNQRRGLIRLVQ